MCIRDSPHAPGLFRDDHQRARVWGRRVLNQTSREVLIKGSIHLFGQNRVQAMRSGGDRSTALRNRDLEGHQGANPKSVFEVENISGNSQSTSPSCSMVEGVHTGSCKSKRNLPQGWRQSGLDALERRTLVWVESFRQRRRGRRHGRDCFICGKRACDS